MIQRKFSIGVCMYGIPLVTAMNASLIFYQEQRVFMCCLWGVFSSKWMSRRVLKACVTTEGTINHRRNKILLKRQSCVRWDSLYQKFPCKLRFCLEDIFMWRFGLLSFDDMQRFIHVILLVLWDCGYKIYFGS